MNETPEQIRESADQQRSALTKELGLTLELKPIPQPDADKVGYKDMCFKYEAAVLKDGKPVITTPFSTGIGWTTSSKGDGWPFTFPKTCLLGDELLRRLMKGEKKLIQDGIWFWAKQPTLDDVLSSLLLEGAALDQHFEDWAADCGYDPDSRKAYGVWEECCTIGRKLNSALGREAVEKLREAYQDY